ncbi:UDP-N-acetylglucosamine 1-carboxyvinyltransferase, partial [Patescibacteria group bacterium]|nr:UDP-N-acetylglucosamine 1-carboxyvinyltransferase [Patescibacteria group bacterium]
MNIKVKGQQVLSGEIYPSGSKNSAVHLIPTTLLVDGEVVLENIPEITDVVRLFNTLKKLGSKVDWDTKKHIAKIDNSSISFDKLTAEDLGNMKGMVLLWGALLARFGKVDFTSLPGGCTLGIRPFEPIFKVFRDLGVTINEKDCGVTMSVKNAVGKEVWLTEMGPTATTNAILVATAFSGKTKIIGAASDPQVQDVCNFLIKTGVKIFGVGSSVLMIEGAKKLKGITYKLLSDHYEIATFLALGACTGGEVRVHNALPHLFNQIIHEFSKFNIEITYDGDTAIVHK